MDEPAATEDGFRRSVGGVVPVRRRMHRGRDVERLGRGVDMERLGLDESAHLDPLGSYLDGVACPSAKLCFAVGFRSNGSRRAVLVERWNGSAWSDLNAPSPKPRSGGPWLAGVSCPTARFCTAVGSDGYGVLVEHWNGSRWVRQTAPLGYRNAVLEGVSCLSATACMSVGEHNYHLLGVLAERWNGKRWSLSRAPNPASSRGIAALLSVSCRSAKECIAVGAGGDFGDGVETLIAERWNGSRWHLQ